ncbi:hypothetical protein [Microseira wollei]|uniref:hypothetical protein n=1 Tax=Microseira wollei TaxID=467598 RepID=UPI001CFCE4E2|nr:hypothetical protein [Microseira wollei]
MIGRELWDFVSDDPDYSSLLLEILRTSAAKVLHQHSISEEIDACCDRITNEFIKKYGSGTQGVDNYIKDIF